MHLTNGIINLEFNDKNGCLCGLLDLRNRVEHLPDSSESTLFRLIVPADNWQSRYIDAQQQECDIRCKENSINIIYDQLKTAPVNIQGDRDILPIQVEVTVELPAGSEEAFFKMKVQNNSAESVIEVWFPKLGGWTGYAGPGKDKLIAGHHLWDPPLDPHAPIIGSEWSTFMRSHKRWMMRYPLFSFLPWLDVSGGGKGLWLINYMKEGHIGGFSVENMKGYDTGTSLAFGWFSVPEITPGKGWISPRFGVGVHDGDWHSTASHYRNWLKSWWRPAQAPRRLSRMLGIQNVIFTSFDGEPVRSFDKLPAIARSGVKYGLYDVCVWDYLIMGTYGRLNPEGLTDYPPEQWEALRHALAETRKLGVSTSMLLNHRLVSPSSDFYKSGGDRGVMRMRDGSFRSEPVPCSGRSADTSPHWMGPQSQVMCQRSKEFRQSVNYHLDRLMDVGFDAFFIDQPFEYIPCFASNHGHESPDDNHQAIAEWVGDFRKRLRQRYPESYIIGEMPDIFVGQAIELWWNWYWYKSSPEVMAYSVPGQLNSWVTDVNIDYAQRGFLYGFLLMLTTHGLEGTLDDVPAFAAYIKLLAELRAKTAYCTTEAQFVDTDELKYEDCLAKRFEYAGGDAVVVVNPTDHQVKAQVHIADIQCEQSGVGRIYRLDGSIIENTICGDGASLDLMLNPRDVVVWDLKRI